MKLYDMINEINALYTSNVACKESTRLAFIRYTQSMEAKYQRASLNITDITDIAKYIVVNQVYHDGNHRTAVMLCYQLSLYINHELLRIKPYLLYAATDFEYFKSMYLAAPFESLFFQGNAINIAIQSRSISTIDPGKTGLKERHLSSIRFKTTEIDTQWLDHLNTVQRKLFLEYAGHRPLMAHSTGINAESQIAHISKDKLLHKPYLSRSPRTSSPQSVCDIGDALLQEAGNNITLCALSSHALTTSACGLFKPVDVTNPGSENEIPTASKSKP